MEEEENVEEGEDLEKEIEDENSQILDEEPPTDLPVGQKDSITIDLANGDLQEEKITSEKEAESSSRKTEDELRILVIGENEKKQGRPKKKKRKAGKNTRKSKKHIPVQLKDAMVVVTLQRQGTHFCGEGYFDTALPSELSGYINEEEYKNAIEEINTVLNRIPDMKTGYIPTVPCLILTVVLIAMMFILNNVIALILFSAWILLSIIMCAGFGVYFVFQEHYHAKVHEIDAVFADRGIRFKRGHGSRHSLLYVAVEKSVIPLATELGDLVEIA